MSVDIIDGNKAADSISIAGVDGTLQVTGTVGDFDLLTATGDTVIIQGEGGNDTLSAALLRAGLVNLTLDGGAGNDTISGSQGADTLIGGDGNDVVAGRQGNDTAFLGAGNDTYIWNPGDGSDFVDGGASADTLQFNGSNAGEKMALTASGGHALLTRDVANINMDLTGVETVNIVTFGGTDTVTINDLAGTAVKTVNVDLTENGLAGTANVIVGGSAIGDAIKITSSSTETVVSGLAAVTHVTGWDAADTVAASGGAGNDTFDVTGLTAAGPHVALFGGVDNDSAILNGTRNPDIITLGTTADPTVPTDTEVNFTTSGGAVGSVTLDGVEQFVVQGGNGDDQIIVQNGPNPGLISFTLDGGAGNDTLRGGNTDTTFIGGSGNDTVFSGRGHDVADLGSGNDTFTWNPGDNSDTVDGGTGSDTLQFNGSNAGEKMSLTANGDHVGLFRDVANINMDLTGIETINIVTFGGNDTVTVNDLTGTGVKVVNVDLATQGTPAAHDVIVGGSAVDDAFKVVTNGPDAVIKGLAAETHVANWGVDDTLTASGGAGNDKFDITNVGAAGPHVALAGGDGNDQADFFGSSAGDTITLMPASDSNSVRFVSSNGTDGTVSLDSIEQFVVHGGSSDDNLTVQNSANAGVTHFTLDGGAGNDVIQGANGAETLIGGSGNDSVSGGQGADTILLGSGNDTFIWNPGDGSDVVDGGAGADTLQFNGSAIGEKMSISANGGHVQVLRDVANINLDVAGVEHINLQDHRGADFLTVNDLTGTGVKDVNIDLTPDSADDAGVETITVNATASNDKVVLKGSAYDTQVSGLAATTHVLHSSATDSLIVQGGAGDDTFDASKLLTGGAKLTFDGGDGNDVLIGTGGDDVLLGGAGDDVIYGGGGHDIIDGGSGNNIIRNFDAGMDKLDLRAVAPGHDMDWVLAHGHDVSGGVVFDFGAGQLTVEHETLASLAPGDFLV